MKFEPSEIFARNQLNEFIEKKIVNYSKLRNFDYGPLDRSNVSLLSPYITHQSLRDIDILRLTLKKYSYKDTEKFIEEIFWRIYWRGWMELRPHVWNDFSNELIRIKKNDNYLNAINANTDIECFNEWINEIKNYNYLHNHTRMWFASIWIFTLDLPWQLGAEFFLKYLYDGDSASNNLSWRWVAGLHTKGKNYIAKDWNIQKYTNNRFSNIELNENPSPISQKKNYEPNDLNFKNKNSDYEYLLIFDNKVSNKIIDQLKKNYKKIYFIMINNEDRKVKLSENVIKFKEDLIKNIFQNVDKVEIVNSGKIDNILNEQMSFDVIYPYVGENQDYMLNLKSKFKLNLNYIYDEIDIFCWQFSKKGFFNFKQNIPKILAKYVL
tara:strand:- start:51 stop:1190 length:1140 start_codon:yes stop_codon:yes gene_type:complete